MRVLTLIVHLVACGPAERIEGTEPGDCGDGADNDADDDGADDVILQYSEAETASGQFELDIFFGAP